MSLHGISELDVLAEVLELRVKSNNGDEIQIFLPAD